MGQLREVRRRREEHHQAYVDLEAAENAAAERLWTHVGTAYQRATTLVQAYGWSHTPFALRLPALHSPSQASPTPEARSWWLRARRMLAARRKTAARTTEPADGKAWSAALELNRDPDALDDPHAPLGRCASVERTPVTDPPHPREPLNTAPAGAGDRDAPSLTAHLLGPLRLALNDVPLDDWPSGRSRALFKYLLTHRDPWPPREVLMEVFWPGATLEAARTNLNVALHGLRRAPRPAADCQFVVLGRVPYRLT